MDSWTQHALEIAITLAVGGLLVSAIRLLVKHRIKPQRCRGCGKPLSRAYPACRWCGDPRQRSAHGWTLPDAPAGNGTDTSAAARR